MPDVNLTAQRPSRSGVTAVKNSIATGNDYKVQNDGKIVLYFEKTGAGDATITFATPATFGGLAVADPTITVGATSGKVLVDDLPAAVFGSEISFSTNEGTGLTCIVMSAN